MSRTSAAYSQPSKAGMVSLLILLLSGFELTGAVVPVINGATIDTTANTITISGVNLLGPDSAGVASVTLGTLHLVVQSSSTTSITAGFPAGSPASSVAPGTYTLTVQFYSTTSVGPSDVAKFQLTVGASGGGPGQGGGTSGFVMSVSPLSCTTPAGPGTFQVNSWQTGAAANLVSNLSISKFFDDCSAALLKLVLMGQNANTATLTQLNGGTPVMTVQMKSVTVTNYNLDGSSAGSSPTEMMNFGFSQITITDVLTGSSVCWDIPSARAC